MPGGNYRSSSRTNGAWVSYFFPGLDEIFRSFFKRNPSHRVFLPCWFSCVASGSCSRSGYEGGGRHGSDGKRHLRCRGQFHQTLAPGKTRSPDSSGCRTSYSGRNGTNPRRCQKNRPGISGRATRRYSRSTNHFPDFVLFAFGK